MSEWLHLILPEPPSSNRYWRLMRGRAVRSEAADAYKARVMIEFHNAKGRTTDKAVAVTLQWYRGRHAGDLDNRGKVVLDALQGLAYANDNQVTELHMYRHDDKGKGRMEVTIREIDWSGQYGPSHGDANYAVKSLRRKGDGSSPSRSTPHTP